MKNEFIHHASRAFFASAWADQIEEQGITHWPCAGEIMRYMPTEVDPEAIRVAEKLLSEMEALNKAPIGLILLEAQLLHTGDRPDTMEYFAHYCAMQAMGHGVGLYDSFGKEVYDVVKVPHIEFSFHSLSKDYF
jgi:hypothetical protein